MLRKERHGINKHSVKITKCRKSVEDKKKGTKNKSNKYRTVTNIVEHSGY